MKRIIAKIRLLFAADVTDMMSDKNMCKFILDEMNKTLYL